MRTRTLWLIVGGAVLVAAVALLARPSLRPRGRPSTPPSAGPAAGSPGSSERVEASPTEGETSAMGEAAEASTSADAAPVESIGSGRIASASATPVELELSFSLEPTDPPPVRVGEGPYVLGRALEANGAPIGSAQLVARVDLQATNVPTTANGAFAVPMGEWLAAERAQVAREHPVDEVSPQDDGPELLPETFEAAVTLLHAGRKAYVEVSIGPHDVSVGDLVLLASELLASGRVVDDRGEPAAGAVVEALPPLAVLERFGIDIREVSGSRVTTDAGGRFELFAWQSGPRFALRACGDAYGESEPVEVDRGSTTAVLVVPRSGSARGQILTVPGFERPAVLVQATRLPRSSDVAHDRNQTREAGSVTAEGRFEIRDLAPGGWVVAVSSPHSDVPLCDGIEIDVSPGETVELGPIDLRDRLWRASFDVVDSHGAAVNDGNAIAVGEAHPRTRRFDWFELSGGRAELITLLEPNRIVLCAPGLRDTQVDPKSVPAVVTMGEALTVLVQVRLPEPLPPQAALEGTLRRRDERPGDSMPIDFDRGFVSVDSDGLLRLDAGECGLHVLHLRIARTGNKYWESRYADVELPDELCLLRVQDREEPQPFTLAVSDAALKRALGHIGL